MNKDPASNKEEDEEPHLALSSDLHTHATAYAYLHSHEYVDTQDYKKTHNKAVLVPFKLDTFPFDYSLESRRVFI